MNLEKIENNPNFQFQDWYSQSFRDVIAYEQSDPSSETLLHFCQTLKTMQARHTNVVQTMAQVNN